MKKLNIGCELDYKEGWINIDFEKSDITNPDIIVDLNKLPLPFQDEEFNFIKCTEVLEHVLYPQSILKELNRIMKPGGILIISMPNEHNILQRMNFLFKPLDNFEKEMPHHFHFTNIHQQKKLYSKYFNINKTKFNSIEGKIYCTLPKFFRNFLIRKMPNLFSINMICELEKF